MRVKIGIECLLPKSSIIEDGVTIGDRVIFAGESIIARSNSRVDSGAIIGPGVVLGQGSWVRSGAVVLKSIPANAIVEGNPATLVGYCGEHRDNLASAPRIIDAKATMDHCDEVTKLLGVGRCALHRLKYLFDSRGALTVGDVPGNIPFTPKRFFVIYNVPSMELRGEHAHILCQQFLVCLRGTCRILLDDGIDRCEVIMDNPNVGVFMPELIWGTQYKYSLDAILLVFASRMYEPEDYIRDYSAFKAHLVSTRSKLRS
jgi:hypothetical protein